MNKTFLLFFLFFSVCVSNAQSPDGIYTGKEPRENLIDDQGKVRYFPPSHYPWYFEVVIKIMGERLDIFKRYAYIDSLDNKHFADSSTNTYHYAAKLVKINDQYVTHSVLINKPAGYIYINDQVTQDANNFSTDSLVLTEIEQNNLFRWYRYTDGKWWTFKTMIEQYFSIKPDPGGIWINNRFYKKCISCKMD